MKRLNRTALFVVACLGCSRRPRPWEGKPEESAFQESRPFLPGAREGGPPPASGSVSLDALDLGSLAASSEAIPSAVTPPASAPTRAGGLWRTCWQGFSAGSNPRHDVERLASLCGPPNGMRPHGEAFEGTASASPTTHPFEVRKGGCYRLFAVGAPGIEDLNVRVTSVRGSRLASDDEPGRVTLVDAERAFCTFSDETLTVEVSASVGSGRYALLIYQLPTER